MNGYLKAIFNDRSECVILFKISKYIIYVSRVGLSGF